MVAIVHTDQREEVTTVTFTFGMAKDTGAGFQFALKRKGRAGAGWKRSGNMLRGDLVKCITERL